MNNFSNFFHSIFKNVAKIFSGWNLLWQALAILLTWGIVRADLDWKWFLYFQFTSHSVLLPAIVAGILLPVILPFILFGIGRLKKDAKFLNTTFALGQSALLGYLLSVFYKIFTGRIPPNFSIQSLPVTKNLVDISHGFRLGFWRGGIFWGWPSSHTTVAFAMATALLMLYPKNKTVKILAIIYALYIGFAVSVSIHWLSEFIAGAIFGSVVGVVVGKSFYKRISDIPSKEI
jgi:membrane-associated phospholipid phosphatase